MPLNALGKRILKKFIDEYGKVKWPRVFYAMEASGQLKNIKVGDAKKKPAPAPKKKAKKKSKKKSK